ncbi:MAG: B12-binding domain-containing radical SAM protein [Nitrospirota bacterium]
MNKPKKVLLITPPYHSGVVESAGVWMNVAFVYLAGSLRQAGHVPVIYDAMSAWHTYDDIRKRIEAEKPDVVGTTAFTAEIVDALKVLKLAKEVDPRITTIIGNSHPTYCYDELLSASDNPIDYIVMGEGEETVVELINCLSDRGDPGKVRSIAFNQNGKVTVTPSRPFIKDLDALPLAWDLVDWKLYTYKPMKDSVLAIVSTSRGCSQKCSFCSQQLFWKRHWRGRSAENVVAELEHLRDAYGVNVVMFADETPTLDGKRWERILDLLIERKVGTKILMETRVDDIIRDEHIMDKYRLAQVDHIYVGVEATTQAALDTFNKNIKVEDSKRALDLINAQDIVSETSFVLGMPDDTPESMARTLELAKYYNPDMAFFLAIAPWPYSEIYPSLKEHIEVMDYSRYNLVEPVVKPKNMTLQEVHEWLGKASREFFTHKMNTLDSMSPKKREFMIKVIHIIATSSYLAKTMKGTMPEDIKKLLHSLKV